MPGVVLVFGKAGQLARELGRVTPPEGWSVRTIGRMECDIADGEAVARVVEAQAPALIVNAAAYTNVDGAQGEEAAAYAVNRDGAGHVARAAAAAGVPVIHISTDYVFDGKGRDPYHEDVPTGPINVYGASKLAGEGAVRAANPRHVILRTSWVYSPFGHNFVRTMLRLAATRPELGVVADQRGCPTAAGDLARTIAVFGVDLAGSREAAWGTYHLSGTGETTWHDFAAEIFRIAAARGLPVPALKAITTADYPTSAARPGYSVLDCGRFRDVFGLSLPPWQRSLESCVREIFEMQAGETS